MRLADVQEAVRRVVVEGDDGARLAALLVGGADPLRRLAIHRRHYHASLVAALRGKFPATAWLIGDRAVDAAAREFVAAVPPDAPCIAEYGGGFPSLLGFRLGTAVPYVEAFATLEWHVGHVAVAVDAPPVRLDSEAENRTLLETSACTLQPGVRYLHLDWPVHLVFGFFLSGTAPESFTIAADPVALELRGARGEFQVRPLRPARAALRTTLARGGIIAEGVAAVLAADPQADVHGELAALFAEELVTDITPARPGNLSTEMEAR